MQVPGVPTYAGKESLAASPQLGWNSLKWANHVPHTTSFCPFWICAFLCCTNCRNQVAHKNLDAWIFGWHSMVKAWMVCLWFVVLWRLYCVLANPSQAAAITSSSRQRMLPWMVTRQWPLYCLHKGCNAFTNSAKAGDFWIGNVIEVVSAASVPKEWPSLPKFPSSK